MASDGELRQHGRRSGAARGGTDGSEWIVIGSGPAGVACASALVESGRRVRMLDAGMTLEPERASAVARLSGTARHAWTPADLREYQAGMNADASGVPLKLVYGSDFAYRGAGDHLRVEVGAAGVRPSLALGGLSNVWGASLLPYLDEDTTDWPFRMSALAPHYAAAVRLTGLAATHDALETAFPLHSPNPTTLRASRQAQQMLDAMGRHRDALARAGIAFGRSRLAVRGDSGTGDGCVYSRLCMYGCPWGYIYNSAETVAQLRRRDAFAYEPNVVVASLREDGREVEVSSRELPSGEPRTWRAGRVFIAAGTVATTGILLRSMRAYDEPVWMKDSQYFLFPLLQMHRVRGATTEWLNALSQVFIELRDPDGAEPGAHVQIYPNSDLISEAIAKAFGPFRRPLAPAVREIQERVVVAQGFLHSRHSSRIRVTLARETDPEDARLRLEPEIDPAARKHVWASLRRLASHARHTSAIPLFPLLKIAEPGRGFHSGGTFPMSARPADGQTDLMGRPRGWERVHAVDATIFPSIPATTITLSVMANAHRIASETARVVATTDDRAAVRVRTA
jgi:choline dehydrogenase-like flavoprotein